MAYHMSQKGGLTMKQKVWFEKCTCGKTTGGNHGYFHVEGRGEYPVAIFSVQSGEIALDLLAKKYGLSNKEKTAVCSQLHAAGMAERITRADVAAADFAEAALVAAREWARQELLATIFNS